MKHDAPIFTCDGCNRPLGLNFKPIEDFLEKERMKQFPLHFCNNNCKAVYQKENRFDRQIYWLSVDWPKAKSLLR